MFYYYFYPLKDQISFFNLFRYVTFRTVMAALTSLVIAFWFAPILIQWFKKRQFGQAIREDGPKSHLSKKGTPSMGGVIFLGAMFFSTVLWARWDTHLVWLCVGVTLLYGALGFWDDWIKVVHKNSKGISARTKLVFQFIIAAAGIFVLYQVGGHSTVVSVPFFKNFNPDLGWFYGPFSVLVVVGASNAVNLTDGLDGLATVPSLISFFTLSIFCYAAGHIAIAQYLQIIPVSGASELAVFSAAMLGGLLGFLWYNTYPAQIFMGDVGSLALGAGLGMVATVTKNELLLPLVGGVFVLETLSVVTQVASFKLTGKRVFKMAPLHHHFELKGWPEPKVIVRFWIISIILAMLALSTLKIR